VDPELDVVLTGPKAGTAYTARWFNPQTGVSLHLPGLWTASDSGSALPQRRDGQDWILVLEWPRVMPDFDRDGDVDAADFGPFQACLSGSGIASGAECSGLDFDTDNDVDLVDFGLFQRCLSGPDQMAYPRCSEVALIENVPLLQNGTFSENLGAWTRWRERGTFTPIANDGELHLRADNLNGGRYQQFTTGGPGTVIRINGTWATDPTVIQYHWAEVLVINGPRLPADGQDENGQDDLVVIYKNDTWKSPAGWSGSMDQTAGVINTASFTASSDVATIILKCGNLGGQVSGTRFDDLAIEVLP